MKTDLTKYTSNEGVNEIIREWEKSVGPAIFAPNEIRFHAPVKCSPTNTNTQIMCMVFTLHVSEFYSDKECKNCINLHHEVTLEIKQDNTSDKYLKEFHRDLKQLTAKAYQNFKDILKSCSEVYYRDSLGNIISLEKKD